MDADLVERLREVPLFHDLADEQLAWFVAQSRVVELGPGEVIIHEGDPADTMFVPLEGEVHSRREKGMPDGRVLIHRAGEVTGMLPFSRLTHFPATARAVERSLVLCFPAARFPELLRRIPQLEPRLVATLLDRIRTTTQYDQQHEKLVSLGRLAAGLTHELNNPAAAAGRAASGLRDALGDVQRWTELLARRTEEAAMQRLGELASTLNPAAAGQLDPIARGDHEVESAAWLEERGVEDGWRLASTLADAGVELAWLEGFGASAPAGTLPLALGWLEARLRAEEILHTIEQASSRISLLVSAVKEYTFMDQAPLQEVDVHAGLDSTLRMLAHKLRGVTVTREYAPELPRIPAMGGALNQLWTNLIDNAADAVGEGGHVWLRTAHEGDGLCVQICDDGPGVPPELQERIFEPFFTTKEVGRGSGLGLDIVRRIVAQHRGSIRVHSEPGDTRFEVRLPLSASHEAIPASMEA